MDCSRTWVCSRRRCSPFCRPGSVRRHLRRLPAGGRSRRGGDFYDVFALEHGQLAVIVGDVSGHGRAALPHTALCVSRCAPTSRPVCRRAARCKRPRPCSSASLGARLRRRAATYNPGERILAYACAGHPPPVVIGPPPIDADHRLLVATDRSGRANGDAPDRRVGAGRSLVCFYTDGVVESRVGGELFGQSATGTRTRELEPDATASALLDRVTEGPTAPRRHGGVPAADRGRQSRRP